MYPERIPPTPFKPLTIANGVGTSRTSAASYERPTRLKGRGDEIKWIELLDKFKSVQERARRQQMQYNTTTNAKNPGGGVTSNATAANMANGSGMGGLGGIGLGATASILSPSRTSTPAGSATNAAGTNATKGGGGRGGGGMGGNVGRLAAPAARRGRKN